MEPKVVSIMIMSGVEDGTTFELHPKTDPQTKVSNWLIRIGRKDDNDLCLRNDTFVSRYHANLLLKDDSWILEDNNSTNGSFIENDEDLLMDKRIVGSIHISYDQLFRVGRTWLRLQQVVN